MKYSSWTPDWTIMTLVAFAGLVSLAGCTGVANKGIATGPEANAKAFTPPAGESGIYVIRKSNILGSGVYWRVFLDVEPLGEVGQESYLYAVVPPGEHNLQVIYQKEEGTTFKTEAGKNYFFLIRLSSTGSADPISESEGRELVSKFKG